jgi:hypothetical protein
VKEDLQRLLDEWQKTYEDLKAQTAFYQNSETKDLSRAVLCQGKALAMGECVVKLYELLNAEVPQNLPSSDPKRQLAELYQRAVQIVLQIPTTIDEEGDVRFEYPGLGVFYFNIDESMPELMNLDCVFHKDPSCSFDAITRICNYVNLTPWPAVLTVDETGGIVSVSVRSFLAAEGTIPDEGLVKAIIPQAMSVMNSATEHFRQQ